MENKELDSVVIEQAKIEDVEEIFNVKMQSWIETYAKNGVTTEDIEKFFIPSKEGQLKYFRKIISNETQDEYIYPSGFYIAKVGEKIVGIAAPMIHKGQNMVGLVYILQEYHNKGIGKRLMKYVLDAFPGQDIYLHVQTENQQAIRFYENLGFVKTKDLPMEYFDDAKTKPLNQIEMVLERP